MHYQCPLLAQSGSKHKINGLPTNLHGLFDSQYKLLGSLRIPKYNVEYFQHLNSGFSGSDLKIVGKGQNLANAKLVRKCCPHSGHNLDTLNF